MALVSGFVLGFFAGLFLIILFVISENRRSKARTQLAVCTAAFSELDVDDVKKLFSRQSLPQWVLFTEYDKVAWLNSKLRKMWPYVDQATSELTRAIVEPILEQYRPPVISSLKFQKFTLGTVAPQFVGVQKVETEDNEIVLEMEIQWDGDPNIILAVKTLVGVTLPIQVKDIGVTGLFRVVFKPLVDELPCFGAVMYSLREQKKLDFKLKVIGGDIKAFPMLAGAVDDMIRTAVTDSFLWPMRQVIPILPGEYSDLQLRPCGKLEVRLIQARHLLNMDLIGKSDPFAQLYIRPIPSRMQKSKTIDNQLNPVWNEVFEFEVEDLATQKLFVHIYDEDSVQSSERIGSAQVPLRDLQPGALTEYWLPLLKSLQNIKEQKHRGEVHVELLYRPFDEEAKPSSYIRKPTSISRQRASMSEKLSSKSFLKPAAVHYKVSPSQERRGVRGVLSVTVVRGEKLAAKDFNGKSDPFVILYMKTRRDQRKKTRVLYKTLNPEWNQSFEFPVDDAARDMLVAEVYDRDMVGKNSIGSCALTLSRVINEGSSVESIELNPKGAGKLELGLKWS